MKSRLFKKLLKINDLNKSTPFEKGFSREAMLFINEVAKICDEVNHHPEIYNCYNRIKLYLSTHDSQDNITKKDHHLAGLIDKIVL